MEQEPEVFICAKCNQKFTLKNNLKRHILKQHAAKSLKSPRMKLKGLCPICKTSAPDILYHFSVDHEIEIQSESIEFQDDISFLNWKKDVEKSTKSLYVISNSRKRKNLKHDPLTFRFTCHRSGEYKCKGKNIRRLKMKKSNKIGGCCPAGMHGTVDKYSQKRYVNFIKTHVGHEDDDLSHLNLSKEFRLSIAKKIANGMSFDQILNDNRNSIVGLEENAETERSHLLTRKDLHNIAMMFDLKGSSIRKNDNLVLEEWANEEDIHGEQLVNENDDFFSFLEESELNSKPTSEDLDILRKDFDDILAKVRTKEDIDMIRRLLKTIEARLNAKHASLSDSVFYFC